MTLALLLIGIGAALVYIGTRKRQRKPRLKPLSMADLRRLP